MTIRFDPVAQRDDPFPVLAEARAADPVLYAEHLDLWVVTRYDDVVAVLKDQRTFSSSGALRSRKGELPAEAERVLAGGCPGMPFIIEEDPPLHDEIRGLVTRAFTPRRVDALEPRVAEIVDELLDELAPRGRADVVESFAWPLPLRVLGELLGVPREDLASLHRWGLDWLMLAQDAPAEAHVQHARGFVEMQRYFVRALEEREHEPRDDLMGALVEARGDLSLEVVAGLPLDLMVAGHVTVTRAIGSALWRLFREPELGELLLDPTTVGPAVEEILRLESPAQGLFRTTTRDAELGGVTIPAGSRVMVHFGSANRDESVFADPESFDCTREELGRHVAFGKGIHFCIGAPLARLELRLALPELLRRLPGLRLADDDLPERERIFFARGFERLVVQWNA